MPGVCVSICDIWSFPVAGASTCRSIWRIGRERAAGAAAAGLQPENSRVGPEPWRRVGVEQPTPGGVPPAPPQPLTHPATDPGPFGRQGLLFGVL